MHNSSSSRTWCAALVCALLSSVAAFASPDAAGPSGKPSVLVLDLKPATDADTGTARLLTDALTQAIQAASLSSRITNQRELKDVLTATQLQQMAGCDDEKCIADLSTAAKVNRIVSGRVGVVAGQTLVFLSLIEPSTASVHARISTALPAGSHDYVGAMTQAAGRLFDPEPGGGEVLKPLTELRLALLFEELDKAGKPVAVKSVEACVGKRLADADARLVSGEQITRLKRQANPHELLQQGLADNLSSNDVDLLVPAVVQYGAGPEMMGFTSSTADIQLQLIQVDNGEVLATEQEQGRGPGGSESIANHAAALNLCETVTASLLQSLEKRRDRGVRVVVKVAGSIDSARAAEIAAEIEALPRVIKAKVRRVASGESTLDVSMRGGDGVTLALDLSRSQKKPAVVDAGPAAITVRE